MAYGYTPAPSFFNPAPSAFPGSGNAFQAAPDYSKPNLAGWDITAGVQMPSESKGAGGVSGSGIGNSGGGFIPNLTSITPVSSQPIKPASSGLGDIYGKNAQAAEAAQLAAFFNQQNFQALGPGGMGIGPTAGSLNDPMNMKGSPVDAGLRHQSNMIDNGQLTGVSLSGSGGGGGGQMGATYSGKPWYSDQLAAGQGLIDTTTGAQTSARQMAQDLAIAQENARLQAEAIQNDRYQQQLLQEKFKFGINQYENFPAIAKDLMAQLGLGGGGGVGIDTTSPFTQEAAQMRANRARSRSAQSAASAQRQIADSMTGAGFGGSSPAIYANQLNAALQGAASGASNAEQIFSDYEDKNANFRLAAQVAASEAQDRKVQQFIEMLNAQFSLLGQLGS